MKPTRLDLLAIIKRTPSTVAELKALYPREDRDDISGDIVAMEACGLIRSYGPQFERQYIITEKGEAALNEL